MRWLVAVASVSAGALLVLLPGWVFPACGHAGALTRCAETARAEMAIGVLLVAGGLTGLGATRPATVAAHAVASGALLAAAWVAPGVLGYCPSPRMACHYGMVPGVRLVAGIAATVLVAATIARASAVRRRRAET